ncbi:hypothetical protein C8E99_2386 [Citricoccus muralis]|uniref:Uncharacterized protein n=1 Tax=Citricoccus muralis TaxID=169134 RepID=A0A3D9LFD1_9MICC|nr:hypothetical protein C8E99_2386 [Citricoccus muralis]
MIYGNDSENGGYTASGVHLAWPGVAAIHLSDPASALTATS